MKSVRDLERAVVRGPTTMIYVGGSTTSFRCSCGANCFTPIALNRYECNGCRATYTGDKHYRRTAGARAAARKGRR